VEIKEKLTKRKCIRTKATEIHYEMNEIKLSYCSLNSPTRRHGYGFYRRKLGLETHVK
jgi:hypothetical protein